MLTLKMLKDVFYYDEDSGISSWINPASRNIKAGDLAGGFDVVTGYMQVQINSVHYRLHRVIWFYCYGVWPECIDHINGIKTDNRIINLRDVSPLENQKNRKLQKNTSSGFTGVSWSKSRFTWYSTIQVSGKKIFIGSFPDLISAVCARISANKRHGFHENHGRR